MWNQSSHRELRYHCERLPRLAASLQQQPQRSRYADLPELPPQPGQEKFHLREDKWPPRDHHKSLGESIYVAQNTPGNVRHDMVIEKRTIGRLLGKGGRHLAAPRQRLDHHD